MNYISHINNDQKANFLYLKEKQTKLKKENYYTYLQRRSFVLSFNLNIYQI